MTLKEVFSRMHMIIGLTALGLSVLFFLLGFIFFKAKNGFGKKLLIGGGIFLAVCIIAAVTDPDFKEIRAGQKKEQAAADEKAKQSLENIGEENQAEIAKKASPIDTSKFQEQIPEIIKKNKDQIADIETTIYNTIVNVDVTVKEEWWAEQEEGKKDSFVTTLGKTIENKFIDLGIVDDWINVEVWFYSDEAGDVVAKEPLIFGDGWDIKR